MGVVRFHTPLLPPRTPHLLEMGWGARRTGGTGEGSEGARVRGLTAGHACYLRLFTRYFTLFCFYLLLYCLL